MLDTLRSRRPAEDIFCWRDKSRREVDFVVRRARGRADVVACRVNPDRLGTAATETFRGLYPEGRKFIVGPALKVPCRMRRGAAR